MKKTNNKIKDISRILFGLILLAWGAAMITGCDESNDVYIVAEDDTPPAAPRGLYSITGDERVTLYWLPNLEEDFYIYSVYRRTETEFGRYDWLADTYNPHYVDTDVQNGIPYFYAIIAVDEVGNESDLSEETLFDTPRPEGFNVMIYDYLERPEVSAFDFSRGRVTDGDDYESDIFFYFDIVEDLYGVEHESFFIHVMDDMTDLQDFGYTDTLTDVTWAPVDGWSEIGFAEIILGHSYIIWTWDDHFATIRVENIVYPEGPNPGYIIFDWAYQTRDFNEDDEYDFRRELKIIPGGRVTTKPVQERIPGYSDKPVRGN